MSADLVPIGVVVLGVVDLVVACITRITGQDQLVQDTGREERTFDLGAVVREEVLPFKCLSIRHRHHRREEGTDPEALGWRDVRLIDGDDA